MVKGRTRLLAAMVMCAAGMACVMNTSPAYAEEVDPTSYEEGTDPAADAEGTDPEEAAPEETDPTADITTESHPIKTGWVRSDDKWNYIYENGEKAVGWLDADGTRYYMNENGVMQTGWKEIEGKWFYFRNNGRMQTGWLHISDNYYYLGKAGDMKTGWWKWRNSWYYFSPAGRMKTGWLWFGDSWYYFDETGRMVTSELRTVSGKDYYFLEDGRLAVSQVVTVDDTLYYVGKGGLIRTKEGWIGSKENGWYYVEEGGQLLSSTLRKIDDVMYLFREDGIAVRSKDQLAAEKAMELGSLRAAFDYTTKLRYGGKTRWNEYKNTKSLAAFGIKNGWGNCFVYAAVFCELAIELGYDAHQVWGYVPYPGNIRDKHSWVEIVIDGTTYVYDPEGTWQFRRDMYEFTYGTPGSFRYSVYGQMN